MNEQRVVEQLRSLQFLQDLSDEHAERLASVIRPIEFAAGKVIFREGDEAKYVYLVIDGMVSLEICSPGQGCRRILTVTRGELLGWSPLLGRSRLTATARALTAGSLFEIDAGQLLAICEHDTRFGFELMRCAAMALAQRLNATRLQLLDIYGSQMPASAEQEQT